MPTGFGTIQYQNTAQTLADASKSRLNNPYYMFADKFPTPVTYYRINRERSTLDESAKITYSNLGAQSSLKYTKINNMLLFGLPKFELDYNVGDFGLEANQLTGDGVVLPNTIRPQEGDMFRINQLKEPLLFMVNKATPDTLDTGANIWKFEFHIEKSNSIAQIEKQVVKVYNFHAEYVGTDYTCFMDEAIEESVSDLQKLMAALKEIYISLFFDEKLQTFVYTRNARLFYDPYLIEFLRRTKLLTKDDGSMFYVEHACALDQLFPIEYRYSVFAHLESTNFTNTLTTQATGEVIQDINSLFVTRMRDYYRIRYMDTNPYPLRFDPVPPDLYDRITSGTPYDTNDPNWVYNVAIQFYSGGEISDDLLDALIQHTFEADMIGFYAIPIAIYTLTYYIKSLMSNNTIT